MRINVIVDVEGLETLFSEWIILTILSKQESKTLNGSDKPIINLSILISSYIIVKYHNVKVRISKWESTEIIII